MTRPLPAHRVRPSGRSSGSPCRTRAARELVPPGTAGAIRLHGRVLDGAGDPVPDALLELWQPGPDGAVVQEPGSLQPGRLDLHRLGPGGHRQRRALVVQHAPAGAEPAGDRPVLRADRVRPRPARPAADPDLPAGERGLASRGPAAVQPAGGAAATLVATAEPGGYAFDVVLQGAGETVFLEARP